jgi:hypothetical protein
MVRDVHPGSRIRILIFLPIPDLGSRGQKGRVKWCGMAQVRRLAVRQARVRFSAWHHREGFPTELTSDEEMERGPGEWRRINV